MEILVLLVLFTLNGFFALSEIALISSKRGRLEQMRKLGNKGARFALLLLDDSDDFLSAIQVGITLIGIITGVFGGVSIAAELTPFIQKIEWLQPFATEISMTFTIVIITYLSIIIGELVPKTIALSNPEKIAKRIAPAIYYFSKVLYPFVKILSASTFFINQLIGIKKQIQHVTESELRQMIKTASSEGVIEKEQNVIHENVFYFSDKKAQHIMTHRTDIEWIDISRSNEEINQYIKTIHHSKVVCCNGSVDNFEGVLYLKDYYKALCETKDIRIADIMVKPIIIPERVDAQKVLNLLRQQESHVCFVVNEYGGFEGIITMYDILENLVGEIPEDGTALEPDMFIRDDKSVLVNGDAPVEILTDIIADFTIDFNEIDYATVAGFVLNQTNRIPKIGDKFQFLEFVFEIVDIDGNRIDKVLITKAEKK